MAVNGLKLLYRFDPLRAVAVIRVRPSFKPRNFPSKGQKAENVSAAFLPCFANDICINSRPPALR